MDSWTNAHESFVTGSLAAVAREIDLRLAIWPRTGPAFFAAISGIDGSGKSRISGELARAVQSHGWRVACIGIDSWQNAQSIRFGGADPGRHFYEHVIRFEALFAELLEPLVANRSIKLATRGIRTDRDAWDDLVYDFTKVDVVLAEGILLFQRAYVTRYDLRIWIECSFATALRRALERNVERLAPERLVEDYERIYHAAQRHHFTVDAPQSAADIVLLNDDADVQLESRP